MEKRLNKQASQAKEVFYIMEAQITDPSAPYYDAYQAAIFAETGATGLNQEQPQGED